jgi:Ras homolog gene family, member A
MECSSKEMTGVHEIFEEAINAVVANDRSNQAHQKSNGGAGQTAAIRKKKRSCKIL